MWNFLRTSKNWWPAVSELFYAGDPICEAVVRNYFSEIALELNISSIEDWIEKLDAPVEPPHKLRIAYLKGVRAVLARLFPERQSDWHRLGSLVVPFSTRLVDVDSASARRSKLDEFVRSSHDDLYSVTYKSLVEHGGMIRFLLSCAPHVNGVESRRCSLARV